MQRDGLPLRSLADGAGRFLGWWRDELWGLVPDYGRRLMTGTGPDLVLVEVGDGFLLLPQDAAGARPATPEVLTRDQAIVRLAGMAQKGDAKRAGIRIPVSRCYSRRMELPKAARAHARRILNLDLERVTPLRLKDVYAAHVEEEESGKGRMWVRQLVAKREAVDPLVADVRAAGLDVAFVDCWEQAPSAGLPVDFLEPDGLAGDSGGTSSLLTPLRALAALAMVLALLAVLLALTRYETALAEIRTETAKMRERAGSVRRVLDRADATVGGLVRLQQMKLDRIPSLEIIEEVSRLLPDSVWLSEFRFEGDALDISGLAKSGAALPSLFAQSAIFADAALTAPLTLDPREDKERFSLRVRIKQPAASEEAAEKAPKG